MSDDLEFEVAYATVVTCRGSELHLVDLAVTRAATRPAAPPEHVLRELRIAAISGRVARSVSGPSGGATAAGTPPRTRSTPGT